MHINFIVHVGWSTRYCIVLKYIYQWVGIKMCHCEYTMGLTLSPGSLLLHTQLVAFKLSLTKFSNKLDCFTYVIVYSAWQIFDILYCYQMKANMAETLVLVTIKCVKNLSCWINDNVHKVVRFIINLLWLPLQVTDDLPWLCLSTDIIGAPITWSQNLD